jgi:hypothetical protein
MTQYVRLPDYIGEGEVRQLCAEAGVLETAIEDFVDEYRAHIFERKEIAAHIAKMRTEKPHRWVLAGTENDDLYVEAFGPTPNMTKQVEVVKLVGGTRAAEIAAQFGTKLGTAKPGTVPASIKTDSTNASNPFLRLRRPDNTVDPAAAAKVDNLIKSLGTRKAEAIAKAVGRTITGLPLQR